ncbi:hypothetical protein ID866_6337 [Astraeus odoratus]|nr:hypothetical protein ID866_6337 [Astraeus odoratus]
MSSSISFEVQFRGTTHRVSLDPSAPVASLHTTLAELTQVPPSFQKLLFRGKKIGTSQEGVTVAQTGLKDGVRVQMLGPTPEELDTLNAAESDYHKKERILHERALKPQVKVSIQHIMQKHKFTVGVLTELAPHEHPGLLGLNVSAGQAIKLRIRTDAYDGFRPYLETRRVLCHELAHNVWGDHDNNFKELNSRLNREVAEFEAAQAHGTHYLADVRDTYQPTSHEEAEALGHVLGGSNAPLSNSVEDRRLRTLEAVTSRLKKQEEELEQSCGTTIPPDNAQ